METNRLEKFRASYSVLSTWQSGDWQRAIDMYLKLDTFSSAAMEAGKEYHKQWEDFVKEFGTLPRVFGGKKLKNPASEQKIVIEVAPWLDFVFIADCVDGETLYEFKSGANPASYWADKWQVPIYAYGLLANGHKVNKAYVMAFNQYNQKVTKSLIWLTPEVMQEGVNTMWTLASEMWDYIKKNKEQLSNYVETHGN